VAIATLVARTIWRPDAESRGLLWAAIASVIAASAGPAGGRATLYLTCAGLVLVVAMVESAYAMAYHDELTGLPARRALNEALQRVEGMYTVAMVDVDHFKKFNDVHGHDVGDQVLRMVAGRLARVDGGGRAFRYGGEEFAVLFAGKTAEESAPHLEKLREAVANASFTKRSKDRPKRKPKSPPARGASAKQQLAVTVSIGVAQARGAALPDEIVKAADKALYRAKEGGRNRVEKCP
jgi:diguanylate cyclase (GGDEF)-like protein